MPLTRNASQTQEAIPAGEFSSWLRQFRSALLGKGGMEVACGECIGCCSSSYFIHIRPQEKEALGRIPREVVFPAPGQPKGHMLMGYDQAGLCPMLKNSQCAIYDHRPQTCREYDCRVFAAAGITTVGDDKRVINQRVALWTFDYPTEIDRDEHLAVKTAARFLREQARYFPGGRTPDNPSQLAILAVKSYEVFIEAKGQAKSDNVLSYADLANRVVMACRQFDAAMEHSGTA